MEQMLHRTLATQLSNILCSRVQWEIDNFFNTYVLKKVLQIGHGDNKYERIKVLNLITWVLKGY